MRKKKWDDLAGRFVGGMQEGVFEGWGGEGDIYSAAE